MLLQKRSKLPRKRARERETASKSENERTKARRQRRSKKKRRKNFTLDLSFFNPFFISLSASLSLFLHSLRPLHGLCHQGRPDRVVSNDRRRGFLEAEQNTRRRKRICSMPFPLSTTTTTSQQRPPDEGAHPLPQRLEAAAPQVRHRGPARRRAPPRGRQGRHGDPAVRLGEGRGGRVPAAAEGGRGVKSLKERL